MRLLIVLSERWHGKLSNDHDVNGVQKVHTTVPRVGGVAVLVGIIAGLLLFDPMWPEAMTPRRIHRLSPLIGVAAPALIAGIIEDVTKRVSVKVRLAATIIDALLASFTLSATVTEINVWGGIYRRKFIKKVSPGAADALHLHTLIYRRVVFAAVPRNAVRPWQRNAAVSLYILPVVACCIMASALFGDHTPVAIALVIAQLLIYVLAYRRLVHGHWSMPNRLGAAGAHESPQQ